MDFGQMNFAPAEKRRVFLTPPPGATWADVAVEDKRPKGGEETTRLMALHCVQMIKGDAFRDNEHKSFFRLAPGDRSVKSVAVRPGAVMEVCFARYWSTQGLTEASLSVTWRGVSPESTEVSIPQGGFGRSVVTSFIGTETVQPSAKLDTWETSLRPSSYTIEAGKADTDVLIDGSGVYSLVLVYEVKFEEAGEAKFTAKSLNGHLYESEVEVSYSESQCDKLRSP